MNKNESKYFNTALLMNEALLMLLENKDYEFITVKEVCKKAGVNRSTFYLHYEGMDDLLKETVETLTKRFYDSFDTRDTEESLAATDKADAFLITPTYLTPYLNFIKQNKRAYMLCCTKPALFNSEQTISRMYKNLFQPIMRKFDVDEDEMTYIFSYYSGGIVSVIGNWLRQGCDKPVDELVELITALLLQKLALHNE